MVGEVDRNQSFDVELYRMVQSVDGVVCMRFVLEVRIAKCVSSIFKSFWSCVLGKSSSETDRRGLRWSRVSDAVTSKSRNILP